MHLESVDGRVAGVGNPVHSGCMCVYEKVGRQASISGSVDALGAQWPTPTESKGKVGAFRGLRPRLLTMSPTGSKAESLRVQREEAPIAWARVVAGDQWVLRWVARGVLATVERSLSGILTQRKSLKANLLASWEQ